MAPMHPNERARLLAERPQVTGAHIDEYQRLLSRRVVARARARGAVGLAEAPENDDRLKELHHLLYGPPPPD